MTHDPAVTRFEPVRNHPKETLLTAPSAAKASAAPLRLLTRLWKTLICNSRRSQPPDFAWIMMSEEVNPAPAPESCFSENQHVQGGGTTAGARPYELLLLAVLLLAVINYAAWQEVKANGLHLQGAAQEPVTALQSDEVALVELEVDPSASDTLPVPYRSKHFYRRTAGVWQPTTPAAAYWGDRRTLETDYFHLEFTEHDAPVVAAVATDLDAILRTLHRQVGLEPPSLQQKLVIQVLPDAAYHWRALDPFNLPAALPVASPTLLPIPIPFTEADMLRSDMIRHLATLTLFRKMAPPSYAAWWNDPGVQGVLRWLIDHGQAERMVLPRYDTTRQAGPQPLVVNPTTQLAALSVRDQQPQTHSLYLVENYLMPALDRQAMTVESVVDYALTTYGQEHLPSLIEAMRRQEDWPALVPALCGVSVATFERGWHESLTKERRQG
ncbi:MAG: hypothetical protein R3C14_46335 [Caldilineaceae bacterium]